jgi:hypothetical protein
MKYILFALLSLSTITAFSQASALPVIKQGSRLSYAITTNDGILPLTVRLDSLTPAYIRFGWSAPNLGAGTWIIKEKSIEKATAGWWEELQADKEMLLPDNQSVVIFSRAQWEGIRKDKKTELDMVIYAVKTPGPQQKLKLNNKEVDALYLENDGGNSKLWILNNPSFPAILKIEGNTAGPDVELKSVE